MLIHHKGSKGINSHGLSTINETLRVEGFQGVFRGYTISAFCTPFFHTLYFPLYEGTKGYFKRTLGWHENDFKLYSLSASLAGICCNVITNPFWVVRTRMQAEIFRTLCDKTYVTKYPMNIFKALSRIYHNEGFAVLYQGLSASMVGVLHPIIYFPLYEKSKIYCMEHFEPPGTQTLSHRYVLVSAVICKALTSLLTYPHEVVRSRQQDVRKYESKGEHNGHKLVSIIKQIKAEGYGTFYSGFVTNLMRITPHYAITFVLYEHFSHTFHKMLDRPD